MSNSSTHSTRLYALRGMVIRGDERGRQIGFPTANVRLPRDSPVPALGVYAGLVDGLQAAVNIGTRPTFSSQREPLLEAHVLNFHGDLYGREVTVVLVHRLRDEIAFASVDELTAQMRRDVEAARCALSAAPGLDHPTPAFVTPSPERQFSGQTALVTGSSRGIGLAIARIITRGGGSVCLTARDQRGLDQALAELGDARAITVSGSADDPTHQQDAIRTTLEKFGSLDLLVNNAAVNPLYGPLRSSDPAAARKVFDVNVLGALAWTQRALNSWLGEHGGVVLNVASLGGLRVAHGLGVYNASKAALIHMTRQLALELAPTVRVNALAPAVVKTEFAAPLYTENERFAADRYPAQRLGTTTDVAAAARFLLGPESSWITGQTLVLDGGLSLAEPGFAPLPNLRTGMNS